MAFENVSLFANRGHEEALELYRLRKSDALVFYEKYSSTFVERACPGCGETEHSEDEPFLGVYTIARCSACQSQYVSPCPPSEALGDYYGNFQSWILADAMLARRLKEKSGYSFYERQDKVIEAIEEAIQSGVEEVNVLEIGANSGAFLCALKAKCQELGILKKVKLSGIDLDRRAVENPLDKDLNLIHGDAETFLRDRKGEYDVIVFFELIEHLIDPFAFMCNVKNALKPGGRAALTTPNNCGFELLAIGYNSQRLLAHAIFPPMHLNAFSTQNILHFTLRCGLKLNCLITPGKLDVDMVGKTKIEYKDELLKFLATADDQTKGLAQALIRYVNGSSHMLVVLAN